MNVVILLRSKKFFVFLGLITMISFLTSCEKEVADNMLAEGVWRGQLTTQGNDIPFNFKVNKKEGSYNITLINGDEELHIEEVNILGDSVFFNMHIFDISIKARMLGNALEGTYSKNYAENYVLPFKAVQGKATRFDNVGSSSIFDGTWETTFTTREGKDSQAIGIFKSADNALKGTFLTKTGDYRYLDGYTDKDTMYLYTFDGNHIYKFKAYKETDSIIKGEFWSGKTGYRTFVSVKNDSARLPDAHSLTYLKEGYDKIEFTFPDIDGDTVSLADEKYRDKVVIVQIFGTWCPNCMDETRFYSDWYKKNKDKGVEIIGLAYEVKDDFDYASKRVKTMKDKLDVTYDFLIAGTSSTKSASESLPMLNKVMSFPTSIFIDRKGQVRRIHTGFSGPATGVYYEEFVEDFNEFMSGLLEE